MKYSILLLVTLSLTRLIGQVDRSIMPKAATPTPIQLKESEVWKRKMELL